MFELPAAALTAEKSSPRKADVGALKMNGREIKEKRFDKAAMFGYKAEEVDLYLAEVAQAFDSLVKEKAVLEKKITILAERIEEYRKDENSMKEALLDVYKRQCSTRSPARRPSRQTMTPGTRSFWRSRRRFIPTTPSGTARTAGRSSSP